MAKKTNHTNQEISNVSEEISLFNQNFKKLLHQYDQLKTMFKVENSLLSKMSDKLFDLANLAIAGTVFVQLIPKEKINFSKLLPGLIISASIYIFIYLIERKK